MSDKRKDDDRKEEEHPAKEQADSCGDYENDSKFRGMEEDRYEIIEGIRYDLSPAPTVNHQRISGALYIMLYHTCQANGTILYSPVDVYLDEENQFQPDLVYVLHENEEIIKKHRIEGVPDLAAEILSPSTSHNDKVRKKRQFERFGLKEYWIIDPVHLTLDQFIRNDDGKLDLYATHIAPNRMTSPLFSCIDIDMNRVFANLR